MGFPLKFVVSAPGKVILFGEHSVIYGKPGLAASVNKRTTLTFETIDDDIIDLNLPDLNFALSIPLSLIRNLSNTFTITFPHDYNKLLQLSEDIIKALENNDNFESNQRVSVLCVLYLLHNLSFSKKVSIGSFRITVSSDLVIGAGTGSSASYSVCLAAALYHYFRVVHLNDSNYEKSCFQFTSEDKKMINEYAFTCEQFIHGTASGIDNFVCTFGSVIEVIQSDDKTGNKTFNLLENAIELRIFLVNTGMDRSTAKMVKSVAELHCRNTNVVDIVLNAMAAVSKTASSILTELKNHANEITHYNFQHLFRKLEDLVSLNHGLLASLGVSNDKLDNIVNITKKYGLHSKLTGAGGGGYAFTLIPPYFAEEVVQNCKKALTEHGYSVDDILIGGMGVNIKVL